MSNKRQIWCIKCGKEFNDIECECGSHEFTNNISKAYKAWLINKKKERKKDE